MSSHQIDHQVDKMRLTKFGFHLNLLRFSTFLSVLGILVSIIGEIGGYVLIWLLQQRRYITPIVYGITGALLVLMIPYLIMWILLRIKTRKQDIPGIEKIGKIYTYVSGFLEIIWAIAWIFFSIPNVINSYYYRRAENILCINGSAMFLIFAFVKIHGVRAENKELLGTSLKFRYAQFILYIIMFSVSSILSEQGPVIAEIVSLIVGKAYFILDIGLTVILHSIRMDREITGDTENPKEKKELLEREIKKEFEREVEGDIKRETDKEFERDGKNLHCITIMTVNLE